MTVKQELKKAVENLESEVNSTLVNSVVIAEAFRGMHPYLLNELIKGLTRLVAEKEKNYHDGRISQQIAEFSSEFWDGIV